MEKEIEIVPAILVKTKEELMEKIKRVEFAPVLQIDLMDGIFVKNKTISMKDLENLPKNKEIEYHLMVSEPYNWIDKLPEGENSIFQVHVESANIEELDEIIKLVDVKKSRLCWAINPPTKIGILEKIGMGNACEILVMAVNPGYSGQSYISEIDRKMKLLREKYPEIIIEVDGGIVEETIPGAVKAGANRLACASAIFSKEDAEGAYKELKKLANNI
ncbi:MAG: hypothetical protein ABIH83_01610 [Candidatus Micrarchaeota archaeon]